MGFKDKQLKNDWIILDNHPRGREYIFVIEDDGDDMQLHSQSHNIISDNLCSFIRTHLNKLMWEADGESSK